MVEATGQQQSTLCTACFTGEYPIELPDESLLGKHLLERRSSRARTARRFLSSTTRERTKGNRG